MNRSTKLSALAALALFGGLAITATSAQARNDVIHSYDPTFAYTGDPAYANSRAEVRRPQAHQWIQKGHGSNFSAGKTQNLPYADRPYGDPDVW
jgi:hypothetical protein